MFGSSNGFGQSSNSNPLGFQTQSMFGQTNNASSNPFDTKPFGSQTGSSMFGGTSTGLFGAPQASSQTFGNSAPSFGCNSTFGHKSFGFSTPQSTTFGMTTPQSLSAFGNSTFGASSSPVLGASSTSSFGSWSSPGFGTTLIPSFGSFGTAFGSGGTFSASSIPSFSFGSGGSFSASSTPSFTFGSSPAFGQSTSTFSTSFCSTQSPFRSQIPQASALMFEGQRVGSRVMPYAPKTEAEQSGGNQTAGKLLSISTMDVYKHKTHEELRWEDYQQGDKGGQLPAGGSRFFQPNFFSLSPATNSFAQNTPSILASTPAHCPTPAMSFSCNLNNSQSSPLFSSNPSLVQTSTNSVFEQNTNPAFSQINTFSTPSTGFANLFSSSPSLTTDKSSFCQTTPVGLTPYQPAQPAQTSISFCFNNFYQTPIANPAGRTESFSEVPALAKSDVMQPILVTNPFGTLPALPQGRNSPSVQYGISNIPVVDKPSPVRISSLLTSRRLLQRRVKLPARKYCSRDDGPKVPFFSDEEDKSSSSRPDIEAILPKLRSSEYFTQPRIQELAAKERVKPGYCKRVRDFVVGRHGYGSIKFLGETDVCKLDLEWLVQFNNREVIVYMDETQKPPVGQGLNKPAEVSLLNVKCMDKKSGKQVTEGSRMDKYKEILKRKAEEQGAQFVSYDALNGEWKFRVESFSTCWLGDEDNV